MLYTPARAGIVGRLEYTNAKLARRAGVLPDIWCLCTNNKGERVRIHLKKQPRIIAAKCQNIKNLSVPHIAISCYKNVNFPDFCNCSYLRENFYIFRSFTGWQMKVHTISCKIIENSGTFISEVLEFQVMYVKLGKICQ